MEKAVRDLLRLSNSCNKSLYSLFGHSIALTCCAVAGVSNISKSVSPGCVRITSTISLLVLLKRIYGYYKTVITGSLVHVIFSTIKSANSLFIIDS